MDFLQQHYIAGRPNIIDQHEYWVIVPYIFCYGVKWSDDPALH